MAISWPHWRFKLPMLQLKWRQLGQQWCPNSCSSATPLKQGHQSCCPHQILPPHGNCKESPILPLHWLEFQKMLKCLAFASPASSASLTHLLWLFPLWSFFTQIEALFSQGSLCRAYIQGSPEEIKLLSFLSIPIMSCSVTDRNLNTLCFYNEFSCGFTLSSSETTTQ